MGLNGWYNFVLYNYIEDHCAHFLKSIYFNEINIGMLFENIGPTFLNLLFKKMEDQYVINVNV